MYDHPDRQADGVGQYVPFAALDHLLGRITARTAGLGGFDRLAVNHPGGRTCLAAGGFAHLHKQHMVDGLPNAAVPPGVEIPLHRCVWRELLGQQAPLAAGLRDVEDGIDHLAHAGLARPPARRRWREMRLDQRPLFIGGIACIAQPVALILGARDFSPGHDVTPRCLRKHERIEAAEITQQFFWPKRANLVTSAQPIGMA
jgi:hypothetical protein